MSPPYVALPQAARRLGVSFDRALVLVRTGQLRARLDSWGRWWVARDSLARLRKDAA